MRSAVVTDRERRAPGRAAYARDEVSGPGTAPGARSPRLHRRVIIAAHHARLRHVRSRPVAAAGPEVNDA